jgi:hypothetical protein
MTKKKTHDPVTGAETEVEATEKIWVVSKQESRMRAGFQFTREARDVEVTEDQFKLIVGDPLLAIVPPPDALSKMASEPA